ncbi:MAG: polysaccharide deacetylase family protein [Candidatus Competibacteraceae bacterium]|nr:polysaccharide deacetylase family protein [Candidatus Competibacteraceae bacterium]
MRRFDGGFGWIGVLLAAVLGGGYWWLRQTALEPWNWPSEVPPVAAPAPAVVKPPASPSLSSAVSALRETPDPAVTRPSVAPPSTASPMTTPPAPAAPPSVSSAGATRPLPPVKQASDAPNLLQACWNQEQLRATANDQRIKNPAADPSPLVGGQPPTIPLAAALSRSIRYVKPRNGEKLLALTFDLCEQANEVSGYDAALVNYLRDHQVRATFFAGGKWMRSHPERTMQLMADPLFELGNHTWTHANLRRVNGPRMFEQISRTQTEYGILRERLLASKCASALGNKAAISVPAKLSLFRFPYGACNAESLVAVNQGGLAAIQWNIVTGDPSKGQTAAGIARAVLNQVKPGSIVIAHANGRGWHTAEALPLIVPELRARGYRFVTVSELLADGEVVAADSCYENKPGDNLKYDRWSGASGK